MSIKNGFFRVGAEDFKRIPGSPIAYWLSEAFIRSFQALPPVGNEMTTREGMATSNNDLFMRVWSEVSISKISFHTQPGEKLFARWYPYNKGGEFRRWFGNNVFIVDWEHDGIRIRNSIDTATGRIRSHNYNGEYAFRPGITWSAIASGNFACRKTGFGFLFDSKGAKGFVDDIDFYLALLNSLPSRKFLDVLAPTLDYKVGDIIEIPVPTIQDRNSVRTIADHCETLSKSDWDSYETSWDFKENPLVLESLFAPAEPLSELYARLRAKWAKNTITMRQLEIRNNEIFIKAYGLEGELSPDVPWNEVSLTCNPWYRYGKAVDSGQWAVDSGECAVDSKGAGLTADHSQLTTAHFPLDTALEERLRADTAKELISYAVGCMMGRYSLDRPGLAFAGGEWSGQWAEISGQFYLKEVVENHVREELQRIGCLAEGDGSRGRDIPTGETPAQGGVVRPVGSDAQSGGVDSVEHRRGTSKKLYEGIRELPVDGKRFEGGIGNAAYDLCSPEILDAITSGNGDRLVRRGWQDAVRVDWEALRARISGQSAAHSPLSTAHSASGFTPDADGILPILDADWFEDDIVTRLHAFLRAAFGEASFHANVAWLEDALGKDLRTYFVKDFYADHVQRYQKRPIYWLFSSRKGAFQALVYLHRYRPDTPGRVLGYLRSYIAKVAARIEALDRTAADPSAARGMRTAALRERAKLAKAQAEIADYERDVLYPLSTERPALDLDDGVKANYPKLGAALRKIF